ncbi:MAG TPA: SRPBCC family protein [Polyangiaceae bacterium]|nr:SRPBCC family protein [Polyangiaceae bacterium]
MSKPRSEFVYVTYIRTTPEKLWAALTEDTEFMKQYWFGAHCESAWTVGAPWKMVQPSGIISDAGEIVEAEPHKRLVIRWEHQHPDAKAEGFSRCTMELEPSGAAVKLSIRHSIEREHSMLIEKVSGGWPKILANLKSLLETGAVVLDAPYPTTSAGTSSGDSVRRQII